MADAILQLEHSLGLAKGSEEKHLNWHSWHRSSDVLCKEDFRNPMQRWDYRKPAYTDSTHKISRDSSGIDGCYNTSWDCEESAMSAQAQHGELHKRNGNVIQDEGTVSMTLPPSRGQRRTNIIHDEGIAFVALLRA
eukprot:c41905_g1_i1 orf=96-503(+)